MVEADGWRFARQAGSHRHYKHPVKPGIVTIAGQPNDDLPKGTVSSILRQASIKLDKEGNR